MAPSGDNADDEGALDALGKQDGPLQGLHAADGAAQHQAQLADAERIEQAGLGADVVANGDEGKIGAVGLAGFRIDGAGPGGTVTGAQHVDADDEIVFEREHGAGSKDLRPPGADQSRAGKRVADQNGVVPRRIEPAVDGVMQSGTRQSAPALERQDARRARSRPRRWARGSLSGRRCRCSASWWVRSCRLRLITFIVPQPVLA